MHIMLKQSICYEYLYIIWLLHTKNSYLKLYLHYQHCEFAFVIRYVYIYFEGCWQVPLKTWKIYFLRKKNWKVDIEGNYIEKYYSKIIFIAQNEGNVFFFTWDTNKLKTNLSIDRFNLQKISICIMNKLVS